MRATAYAELNKLINYSSAVVLAIRPTNRVNFTNILRAAFTSADPKSAKRQSTQAACGLSGSGSVKAACKHIDEIDPWLLYY